MALVSIGLPVFNGEKYIRRALESFLAQSFGDFEVIVCDNASSDATEVICREFTARDRRIRYHRNAANIGAGPNFNLAFKLSSARYFKWAAHDDYCAPEYLEKMVDALESDASIVLCSSEIQWVDELGQFVRRYRDDLARAASPSVVERFRLLSSLSHGCFDIFGLMRREVLKKTPLIASYIGSDRALLAEMGLYGRVYRVPQVLFFSRDHPERSLRALKLHERGEWWDPALKGKHNAPWWRLLREYHGALSRAPLQVQERLGCQCVLFYWMRRNWRFLLTDVGRMLSPAVGTTSLRLPAERAVRTDGSKIEG
jgi:glycosyltransferase involved in cell wall biosynthesis